MTKISNWHSSIHTADTFESAFNEAKAAIKKSFGRTKPDLGLLFVSCPFREEIIDLWPSLRNELPVKNLIGCTAGGVIGGDQEIENQNALVLTAASLPDVTIRTFDLQDKDLPSIDGSPKPWKEMVGVGGKEEPEFIILSDPFSMNSDGLVGGLDFAFPKSVKVGGLASGGAAPKENLLINNQKLLHSGAVGISLSGNIHVEPVVAQGCRPIGHPLAITKCKENVLLELENKPPLKILSELYQNLSPRDQELLTHSLFLGIVMDPFNQGPKQGDFLIRNIIGLDQEHGFIALGALLRPGQTVQFHLRDAKTSHEDLQLMLSKTRASSESKDRSSKTESGAVLFSCLGRGERLYGKPNHDISTFKSVLGNIPVGGFFCNGEIGPVGGTTYLHGYTSSIAIFSQGKEKMPHAK